MATLEKPKPKKHKTKKTKTVTTEQPEIGEIGGQTKTEENPKNEEKIVEQVEKLKIDEKINETQSEIEACSSKIEIVEKPKNDEKIEEKIIEAPKIDEKIIEAPKIDEKIIEAPKIGEKIIETPKIVTYPSLPVAEQSEVKAAPKVEEKCDDYIKPFTESQLTALYTNQEITASRQFIQQFIETELRGVAAKKHPLYDLITSYLSAREKLKDVTIEINQLRNDFKDTQEQLWSVTEMNVSEKGACADASTLWATHTYTVAKFNWNVLESLGLLQKKIKRLANHAFTLYSFNCCLFKLKIEYYLDKVYKKCETYLNTSGGVVLREDTSDKSGGTLQDLRLCISVLFYFQRQLHKDKDVVAELRHWLTNMIALLLRNADWQDHMYLLNHVLRCPAGIHQWATNYIQVPSPMFYDRCDTPFANRFVNHIIAVLSVILLPVDKRDAFLEQMVLNDDAQDIVAENVWVLVDSDGESDDGTSCGVLSLKENDLVALLNQIPLDYLFSAILLIEHKNNEAVLDVTKLSEHHILRLFAFSTILMKLLNNGLATYATMRYNQFAKRLCRLMRHVLQYASDAWEIFKRCTSLSDRAMLNRLQVEFDAFFLRTSVCLFNAQARGSWQFLAIAPFHMVSVQVLWQFFYMLHLEADLDEQLTLDYHFDFKAKLMETSTRQQFNEHLNEMSVEQSYYLLNTFGNMILARNSNDDSEFIKFATLNLLQIGFTESENEESSRKTAAILLANITQKYPTLISDILCYIRANIEHFEPLIFLFSELPLFLWRPSANDMDTLSAWLLDFPAASVQSFLARKIFLNLNWNYDATNVLFLPLLFHRQTAVLLIEAVEKHQQPLTLVKFSWSLIFQLRLHSIDRGTQNVDNIPDIIRHDVLQRGVRQKMALALYCAVAMTTVGHLIPLVCRDGLDCLLQLTLQNHYEATLFALYQIVPLFLDNIDALLMCSVYQNIVGNILNNTGNLEAFSSMIQMHLHHPEWRKPLFIFWTKSLLMAPQWNTNKMILTLLDRIVEVAFFIPDIYQQIEAIFRDILIEKLNERNNGANSSLLSWVPLVGNSGTGSSVLIPGNGSEETWLMYLIISLECQEIELKTGLWPELLKQLFATQGKTNIDATLKKVTNKLKLPNYNSNGLCIYRWSQLALDNRLNHPLLPLIWQKFFFLYLERVPGPENNGSIGNKFFDGVINTSFLKKIKRRLQETVEYLKKEIEELPEENEQKKLCLNIFKAYILWLEEPIIMEATLYFPSLPPQYETRYLSHTIEKTTSPWMELINLEIVRKEYEQNLNKWIEITGRKTKYRPPLQRTQTGDEQDPKERMLRRLVSYDRPAAPPQLKRSAVVIPALQIIKPEEIRARFHPEMKKLQQYAEIYTFQVSEHTALESQFKELIPKLYKVFTMKKTSKRSCSNICAGAAIIKITYKESRINEAIQNQIEANRSNLANLLARSLQTSAISMCVTCACVQQTVELLIAMNQQPIGIELYFYFLDEFTEEFKLFPPTQQTFYSCLERLGDVFLKGVESQILRLLQKILEKPGRSPLIIPHFNPVNLSTNIFLQVYEIISEQIQNLPEITLTLISKFDLNNWLMSKKPRLSERSKLIKLIFECLIKTAKNNEQLHTVYRRHLLTVFQYEFPNHYGEILQELLHHSGAQTISVAVWLDIINCLAHPITINLKSTPEMIDSLRRHAIAQQCLHRAELQETISLLGRYFHQERMQFGLYGLYPKYREYIAQISVFFGETYFAFTISILNSYSGEVADNLVSIHLWSKLVELFAPWLVPYSVKDNAAAWIQQLTDDRAVLLPWIQADVAHAQYVFNMFVDCVLFVADTLPASGCLYSNIWTFYASHFAHTSVKDPILAVVHSNLSRINWTKFWPTLSDLEIMLKVLDQYLPDCHSFLGRIFLQIDWDSWLTHLDQETEDYQILARANHCLLHLVVKLANEPTVRQNNQLIGILSNWQRPVFRWSRLEVKSIESVFDWYIMSCDSRVVISCGDQVKEIDNAVYIFLKYVSYNSLFELYEGKTIALQKRLCYIRAWNRILINCSTRHKTLFTSNEQLFSAAIFAQITSDFIVYSEVDILMREILTIINNPTFTRITTNCICNYLTQTTEANARNNQFLFPLMRSIYVISDDDASSSILEQILISYFHLNDDWNTILEQLSNLPPKPKYDTVLIQNGCLFSLYVILMKKMAYSHETLNDQIQTIINWLTLIKVDDSNEIRLPLFWIQIIRLSLKLCENGQEETAACFLNKFVNQHLLLIEEHKNAVSSWGRGLLGAIGLIKPNNCVSIEFRFIAKTMAAFILAQLPDAKNKMASVRTVSGGGCCVGQPGGNTDCAKVLLKLETSGMSQEIKAILETSLKYIQNPENSLINAEEFLLSLINQIDKYYRIQHFKNV